VVAQAQALTLVLLQTLCPAGAMEMLQVLVLLVQVLHLLVLVDQADNLEMQVAHTLVQV
jgi:hypothetical protein